MLSFFNMGRKMQGYKITDNKRTKKYGIGADSLKMLKDKAKVKFPMDEVHIYLSKDGFEVTDEDYFRTLEPQSLFVVAGPNEEIITESELEFQNIKSSSPLLQAADIIYDFIEKNPEKFKKMILEYEKNKTDYNEKTVYSLRSEHQEWFQGQDDRYTTKEEALAKRAQDRMRGYYYKTKDEITKHKLYRTNLKAKEMFEKILEKFRYLLIGCDYFSMIFDRNCKRKHHSLDDQTDAGNIPNKRLRLIIKEYTTKTELLDQWSVSLCTDDGDFHCQGSYSSNGVCPLNHKINPYSSRENLILFQVWNLDHQIEMTRTIIPSLIENVRCLVEGPNQKCPKHKKNVVDLSILEYFLELFSLKNLRLVHIVCHEKFQRTNKSNGHLICEKCSEYLVMQELINISCPEEVDF